MVCDAFDEGRRQVMTNQCLQQPLGSLRPGGYCRLEDFRRIATRYDKLARNFFASVCLVAAVVYWSTVYWM
jgi:transposase